MGAFALCGANGCPSTWSIEMVNVHQDFKGHLKDLQSEAINRIGSSASNFMGKSSESALYDPRFKELKQSTQRFGKSISDNSRDNLLAVTENFEKSGFADVSAYREKLDTIKQQAYEKASDSIFTLYDQARSLGEGGDNSFHQDILQLMEMISSLIKHLADQVSIINLQLSAGDLSGKRNLTDFIDREYRNVERQISLWFSDL